MSWLVFSFIPASNLLVPVGFVVAERVLYTPSMGFTLMLAVILVLAHCCYPRITITLFVLLLAVHSARVIQRNYDWRSDLSLVLSALEVCPRSVKVRYTYAKMLIRDGKYEEAIPHLKVAMEIDPKDPAIYHWLAEAYLKLNRKYEALDAATQAFVLHSYEPDNVDMVRRVLAAIPYLNYLSGPNDPFLIDIRTGQYIADRILQFLVIVGEYLNNPRLLELAPRLTSQIIQR
jgi:tetratricopeptide (TPR) repeat protein